MSSGIAGISQHDSDNIFRFLAARKEKRYRLLKCTILNRSTGKPEYGCDVTVDHHLGGSTGPSHNDHFCQSRDEMENGIVRIVAAPSSQAVNSYPERMGINIERREGADDSFQARFFIPPESWVDGTWKSPSCTHWSSRASSWSKAPGPDRESPYFIRLEEDTAIKPIDEPME